MKGKESRLKRSFAFILLFFCFLGCKGAYGAVATAKPNVQAKIGVVKSISELQQVAQPSPVQPQPVDFSNCNKVFKLNSQKLFYLTLAGVNANRFKIDEIQSKSGYVRFSVAKKQFLASVINVDPQTSMLKITPCNNVYYFPIGIVQNMFKYIELNINTPIEKLSVL